MRATGWLLLWAGLEACSRVGPGRASGGVVGVGEGWWMPLAGGRVRRVGFSRARSARCADASECWDEENAQELAPG